MHDAPHLLEGPDPPVLGGRVAAVQGLPQLEPQQRHLVGHRLGHLLLAPLNRQVSRVLARRQERHPGAQGMAAGQFTGAKHGFGPGPIRIEHEGDVAGEAHHQADLSVGQRCAHRRDDVLDSRLRESQDIRVAFHHHDLVGLRYRAPRLVEPVEQVALLVQRSFRRVEVLGVLVLERPAPEPHHSASVIYQREHQPAAEAVVRLARLAHQEAGFLEFPV